jgi:sugar/nucleoside kinase (ribokinase family)
MAALGGQTIGELKWNRPTPHNSNHRSRVIGILVADLFVPPLPRLPEAGELLHVDDFLLSVGGCAANTAVDLARLGGSATVFGKVGQDLFGDFVVQELARQGAETDGITRSARQPTSRTMILPVAGENRRYIHSVGRER